MPGAAGESVLDVAESGGRHAGFVALRNSRTSAELRREARTLRTRATDHSDKIANRIGYNVVSDDPVIQTRAEEGRTRHLQREIENFLQQAELCELLAARKTRRPD